MRLLRYGIIFILILTAVVTLGVFPLMPDTVPSHWNSKGEVDAMMPSFLGLLVIPVVMYSCCALFAILPRIDPLRNNYAKFMDYYNGFILVFTAFLFCIQIQIILWALGVHVNPNLTFPVFVGILFIYVGFLVEHAEPNWFVGIRTPWTLSNEMVWKKTHQRGVMLFKIAGVLSMAGILAGSLAWLFILVPVLAIAVYTVVYSYFEYRKEIR